MLKIGVDAMGGDFAPEAAVQGAVMYQFIWNLTDNELMLMGHNKKEGKNRLGLGIEMIDMLADYSEEAAEEEFWDFMDTNFPGVKLPLEAEHRKPSRWNLLWSK